MRFKVNNNIISILLFLLIVIGCSDESVDPITKYSDSFYPLSEGNYWNYELRHSSGFEGEPTEFAGDISFTIDSSTTIADTIVYHFNVIKNGVKIETTFIPGKLTEEHDTSEFYDSYNFEILKFGKRILFRDDQLELEKLSNETKIFIDIDSENDTIIYSRTFHIAVGQDDIILMKNVGMTKRYYSYSRVFWSETINLELIDFHLMPDEM